MRPPPTLVAQCRRVAPVPAPLDLLSRLEGVPGAFLRLVAGPGFRGRAWSFLGVAAAPRLVAPRWPAGRSLAEVLAPLAPTRVRVRGPRPPFVGGWFGYLGYEARSGVERTPKARPSPLGFPALWLGWVEAVLAFEHATGRVILTGLGRDARRARAAAQRLVARLRLEAPAQPPRAPVASPSRRRVRPAVAPTAYRRAVQAVRRHVRAGDVFQVNLSQRFDARVAADPTALFAALVAQQPAPYMTFLALPGGRAVLSASPERFLEVAGERVATDPMKGTRPRGRALREDQRLRAALEASEKDRAELAMIVDLSRNDLARVCRPGSVRVRVARRLLPFARVHQAIAVVEGRLRRGRTRMDLLQACFPPGSVTGAPKVRALEIIDALEREGRGPYCGAIGWWDAAGGMDLAVAIRTVLLHGRRASYRVGGGITLRSDPTAEWRETLVKGRGLAAALAGGPRP